MDDTRACSNVDVVDRFLDLLTAHDIAAATAMFTEDAELVAPYSPPPLPPGGQGARPSGCCSR